MNKIDFNKLERYELNEDSIDDYLGYFNLIKEEMNNPEFMMDLSKEYLLKMLKRGSHIYVYTYDDLIIASGMLLPCDQNAIKLSGLNKDYHEVVEYGPQFVHPDYRGNNLQFFMIDDLRYVAKELGFKYAIGVINENNEYSNNTAKKCGIFLKKIKLDGKIENVYYNDLSYLERK